MIAMTKLYSPFKTHYSIQIRRVVSNITSINSFLKGGAPIPKSIKCSTDQWWKSSDISSSIKQGELDHSKDYFCIGCTLDYTSPIAPDIVVVDMPFSILIFRASKSSLLDIAKVHNAGWILACSSKDDLVKQLRYHVYTDCPCVDYFFRAVNQINSNKQCQKAWHDKK